MRNIPTVIAMVLLLISAAAIKAACLTFVIHVIKPPRPGAEGNTVPSMVWLHDVDADGRVDLVASHVAWMDKRRGPSVTTMGRT